MSQSKRIIASNGENGQGVCQKVDEYTFNEVVFDIIEEALQAEGYAILEGDCDTVYLRSPNGAVNFMLRISHIE